MSLVLVTKVDLLLLIYHYEITLSNWKVISCQIHITIDQNSFQLSRKMNFDFNGFDIYACDELLVVNLSFDDD